MKTTIFTIKSHEVLTLIKKDSRLKKLFEVHSPLKVTLNHDPYEFLIYTIIGQQISVKQADTIFASVKTLTNNQCTPNEIARLNDDSLTTVGIPNFKIAYIRELTKAFQSQHFNLEKLNSLSQKDRINHLTQIPGIGPWSAEMFCMFVLADKNLFSVTDTGLQNALKKYFNNPNLTIKNIRDMALLWEPYQSIVAHYLWAYWD